MLVLKFKKGCLNTTVVTIMCNLVEGVMFDLDFKSASSLLGCLRLDVLSEGPATKIYATEALPADATPMVFAGACVVDRTDI